MSPREVGGKQVSVITKQNSNFPQGGEPRAFQLVCSGWPTPWAVNKLLAVRLVHRERRGFLCTWIDYDTYLGEKLDGERS